MKPSSISVKSLPQAVVVADLSLWCLASKIQPYPHAKRVNATPRLASIAPIAQFILCNKGYPMRCVGENEDIWTAFSGGRVSFAGSPEKAEAFGV
jgi:hypothetical protein